MLSQEELETLFQNLESLGGAAETNLRETGNLIPEFGIRQS